MIECEIVNWLHVFVGFLGGCVFAGICATYMWPTEIKGDEHEGAGIG